MGGGYVSNYSEEFPLLKRVDVLEQASGGSGGTVVQVTADYSVQAGEICLVSSTGLVVVTLPEPQQGALVTVKNTGTGTARVVGLIDGQSQFDVTSLVSIVVVGDGQAWWVL